MPTASASATSCATSSTRPTGVPRDAPRATTSPRPARIPASGRRRTASSSTAPRSGAGRRSTSTPRRSTGSGSTSSRRSRPSAARSPGLPASATTRRPTGPRSTPTRRTPRGPRTSWSPARPRTSSAPWRSRRATSASCPVRCCDVRPVEEYKEKDAPFAYYYPPAPDGSRPGIYYANGYDLPEPQVHQARHDDLSRGGPGPPLPDHPRDGEPAPQHLPPARGADGRRRLRRGLGPVQRAAGRRDGPLPRRSRALRDARRAGMAGGPARRRHRAPRPALAAPALDRLPQGRRPVRDRRGHRDRPLHLLAGPGADLQDRPARDRTPARASSRPATARRSTCGHSTTPCWATGRCRWRPSLASSRTGWPRRSDGRRSERWRGSSTATHGRPSTGWPSPRVRRRSASIQRHPQHAKTRLRTRSRRSSARTRSRGVRSPTTCMRGSLRGPVIVRRPIGRARIPRPGSRHTP